MNRKLLILLFFLVTFLMKAQNGVWTTNVTDAIALSNEQRKPLLILFTGTGASESIQREVFNTPEFQNWSRKKVILVKLDLSADTSSDVKEQNIKLKNAFSIVDLPEVCFAFANTRNGKTMFQALGKLSYKNEGARSWISESELILNPSE
ncbi:MAG: thioredoxin family protein [Flavobacterium circumlabens]|uniref:thioredoxin family protein n=1 Tax=Flavobacterium circumlabens TaxID=2133765 RepID=UPI00326344F2